MNATQTILIGLLAAVIGLIVGLALARLKTRAASTEQPASAPAQSWAPGPNAPKFTLEVPGGNVFVPSANHMQGYTGFALAAKVWNTGTPAALARWKLVVHLENGSTVTAASVAMPETLDLHGKISNASIEKSNSLEAKLAGVRVGDVPLEGTLLFYAKVAKDEALRASTVLEVIAEDVFGGETSGRLRIGDAPQA